MKGKIYFFGILLMLLVLFIAAVQGINWGIENSWTPDNVKNDPLGAFNTNPERAVSLHPKILDNNEIAKKWFNEGDIAKHIQLQPNYAKEHFEGNGLGGVGGEEYVKHVTDNKVRFVKGRNDITISERIIKNNKVSLDLTKYEQGTIIEPDGTNGFKVIPPGKGEVSIVADTQSKIDYDAGTFIAGNNKFGAESVSKISIDKNNIYTITTKEGRVVEVFSKDKFEFSNNVLAVGKDARVSDLANGAITEAYGATKMEFVGKEGYKINGNFVHKFDLKGVGKASIPSTHEILARKSEVFEGENRNFCYKCGIGPNNIDKIEDKTIVFDGKDFYVKGMASVSIYNGKETFSSEGLVNGVVLKMNGREKDLLNVDENELRLSKINKIEKERNRHQERRLFAEDKETDKQITEKLKKLPERLSDEKVAVLKNKGKYEGKYFGNYEIEELDDYKEFSSVAKSRISNDKFYHESEITYNPSSDDEKYGFKIQKSGLFSEAIENGNSVTTGIKPLDYYSFKTKGEEKWNIQKGSFYALNEEEPLTYLTDTKFYAGGGNGVYNGNAYGDISRYMGEQLGGFSGGVAERAYKGKYVPLLNLEVTKDRLVVDHSLTKDLVPEISLTDKIPHLSRHREWVAEQLKTGNYFPINGKINNMVDKGVIPKEMGQIISDYVSQSLDKIQPTRIPDEVDGFSLVFNQINDGNAKVSLIIRGDKGSILNIPEKVISAEDSWIKEANSRMESLSKIDWRYLIEAHASK